MSLRTKTIRKILVVSLQRHKNRHFMGGFSMIAKILQILTVLQVESEPIVPDSSQSQSSVTAEQNKVQRSRINSILHSYSHT